MLTIKRLRVSKATTPKVTTFTRTKGMVSKLWVFVWGHGKLEPFFGGEYIKLDAI